MIHFDFIVSDEEAATIFECINEEIERMHEEMISMKCSTSVCAKTVENIEKAVAWLEGRIDYLKTLKQKMKNDRVD